MKFSNYRADLIEELEAGSCSFTVDLSARDCEKRDLAFLDSYISKFNYEGLGDEWVEIDKDCAECVLTRILHKELVYSELILDIDRAKNYAVEFLSYFRDKPQYFTNVAPNSYTQHERWSRYTPIASDWCTADAGVVALDVQNIGIIWQEDED